MLVSVIISVSGICTTIFEFRGLDSPSHIYAMPPYFSAIPDIPGDDVNAHIAKISWNSTVHG